MKVLFIVPNTLGKYFKPATPHAGISYLAAVLMEHQHDVKIVDMRLYPQFDKLVKKIEEFKPDFLGVTSASKQIAVAYNLIANLKEQFQIPIIIGGAHASTTKGQVLKECQADFAVIGEGEYPLLELIEDKAPPEILGLAWRHDSQIIENSKRPFMSSAELNQLPFPAYDKSPLGEYLDNKIPILSSRGCPYGCTYCAVKLVMGNRFRPRSAQNVVDEIAYWYDKGYTYFGFNDDNFTNDMQRAEEICDLILNRSLKIRWELRNGIRANRINKALARKMKQAGCFFVAFGVESANQEVLNQMRKGIKIQQVIDAVAIAKTEGFRINLPFIVGMPGSTYDTFKESLDFAKSMDVDELRFYNAVPYPGTALYDWIKREGRLLHPQEEYLNSISMWEEEPIFDTPDFPREERIKAYREGEQLVMQTICRSYFGRIAGSIALHIWKNKFMRRFMMKPGQWLVQKVREHRTKKDKG